MFLFFCYGRHGCLLMARNHSHAFRVAKTGTVIFLTNEFPPSLTLLPLISLGLEKLDAQIVEWMNRYNVTADTWVLPPKPAMYLSLVPQEKIYYYLAGEEVSFCVSLKKDNS